MATFLYFILSFLIAGCCLIIVTVIFITLHEKDIIREKPNIKILIGFSLIIWGVLSFFTIGSLSQPAQEELIASYTLVPIYENIYIDIDDEEDYRFFYIDEQNSYQIYEVDSNDNDLTIKIEENCDPKIELYKTTQKFGFWKHTNEIARIYIPNSNIALRKNDD